jgi:malate dehydrogenase
MYADYRFATIDGAASEGHDQRPGLEQGRVPAHRGQARRRHHRGARPVVGRQAANAAIDHMRDWALGTNGEWVTMGVPSNGEYGIPKDVMFGYPVTCEGGKYKIVEGLPIDAFSQSASTRPWPEPCRCMP